MPQIAELAAQMRDEYQKMNSWNQVADKHHITKPLAWKIAKKDHEPKRASIRRLLDLPELSTVVAVAGNIPPGAQAYKADFCIWCGRAYISNHPKRRKCFVCSKYRGSR